MRKLVVWSQTVVYGAHPLNPNFLSEEHELRGHVSRSRFVKDKVEVERQVRRFRDEHDDTIVTTLRTAATLGPHIRNFATRFFSRPMAPMLMGYDPLMQFVHERDVVDAFYARRRQRLRAASSTSSARACCPTRRSWR